MGGCCGRSVDVCDVACCGVLMCYDQKKGSEVGVSHGGEEVCNRGSLKSVGGMFLKAGIGGLGAALKIPGFKAAANGAFISGPTPTLVGEGGESEYVIPSSKMNEAMGRYARGARGGAVIPEGSGGDASGGMIGGGGSIDVSYSVERINNVNYVTAAEFERGMAQAAKRGAELGRRNVYSDLVNKRSVRSRVGV